MPIEFRPSLDNGSEVIVAISMDSDLTGNKLKEVLEALKEKNCKVTVLVADTLQKYNSDYETALKKGDAFLHENSQILNDTKVLRWHEYISLKQEEFDQAREMIEELSKPGGLLHTKMLRTQKKCKTSTSVEKSLAYQKEEYAVLLTMSAFEYHIYSKPLSPGMACVYQTFKDTKLPAYIEARFLQLNVENTSDISFFKSSNKAHENSIPIEIRIYLNSIESILKSSEVSNVVKLNFIDKLYSILVTAEMNLTKRQEKESKRIS